MKTTYKDEFLPIPANVTVEVKSRVLRVKGPRGTLTKNLNHLDMEIIKKDNGISFQVWHGKRKHVACLRTARALIANLITGVTKVRHATNYLRLPLVNGRRMRWGCLR